MAGGWLRCSDDVAALTKLAAASRDEVGAAAERGEQTAAW